jgi:ketol-acid reductoisomerase
MRVYYDRDADINLIKTKKVAIVGYGSQGHAQRSTCAIWRKEVAIALRGSPSGERPKRRPQVMGGEAASGPISQMLTPDELQGDIYRSTAAT